MSEAEFAREKPLLIVNTSVDETDQTCFEDPTRQLQLSPCDVCTPFLIARSVSFGELEESLHQTYLFGSDDFHNSENVIFKGKKQNNQN